MKWPNAWGLAFFAGGAALFVVAGKSNFGKEWLQGLSLVPTGADATVYSDSQYVINGACSWLDGWKRKGWKTSGKSPVLNRDLWESIDAERERLRLSWQWIRGHFGHVLNERADTLARQAILAHGAKPPTSG